MLNADDTLGTVIPLTILVDILAASSPHRRPSFLMCALGVFAIAAVQVGRAASGSEQTAIAAIPMTLRRIEILVRMHMIACTVAKSGTLLGHAATPVLSK